MVLDMSKAKTLKIGREEESDIRFKHPSISRKHCTLKINNNNISLIDKDSKYGTYISLNRYKIKKKKDLILQIGKFLLEFHFFKKTPC